MPSNAEEWLNRKESQFFDRKSARIQIGKLAEAIVGFANADGGQIVIGIHSGRVEGVDSQGDVKVNDFIQCGFDQCVPSVKLSHQFVEVHKENGETDRLLVLEIPPSVNILHTTKSDIAFLRVGDETKRLTYEQRMNLEFDKGTRLYEDSIIGDCLFEDLNKDVLEDYKEAVKYKEDDMQKLLFARGFAKRNSQTGYQYTAAAVLMFSDYPTRFISGAKVRFIRYDGTKAQTGTRMNIIKQETMEGPIPMVIEEAKKIIDSQLREFTALEKSSGRFTSVPEYPPFAWQEGLINAITHRAYNLQGDDIKVIMYDDRLEIISPGRLPSIVNVQNIREVRYSRNPRIARALTEIGYVRELGEGVKRIYEEMDIFFLEEPLFEENAQSVSLTLKNNIIMRRIRSHEKINYNISGRWDRLHPEEQKALEVIFNNGGTLKTMEFANSVGITRPTAKRILEGLVEKEILEKISTSRNDPNQYYKML